MKDILSTTDEKKDVKLQIEVTLNTKENFWSIIKLKKD